MLSFFVWNPAVTYSPGRSQSDHFFLERIHDGLGVKYDGFANTKKTPIGEKSSPNSPYAG